MPCRGRGGARPRERARARAHAARARPAGELVTLDLRALTFIDVAGVRAIQDAQRIASEAGRRMLILGPHQPAARILELTGTLDLVR